MNQTPEINQSNIELHACPISCTDCNKIYQNENIPQKIICLCKCHKEKK